MVLLFFNIPHTLYTIRVRRRLTFKSNVLENTHTHTETERERERRRERLILQFKKKLYCFKIRQT